MYDGDGRRATKTVGGVTTYFLYDGDRLLEEETDPSGTSQVTTAYGWGVDGLRARYAAQAQGNYISRNTSFGYLYDPSGNVAARLEFYLGGSYVGARDYQVYDGFGSLTGHWDAVAVVGDQRQDLASVGFGGQAGYYTDQETGLVLLGARYYDPSTGRFLNRDPIGYGGGINLYGFCGNNPVNETDPSGEAAADWLDELKRGDLGGALRAAQYYFRKGLRLPSYKGSIGFSVNIGPFRVGAHVSVTSGNCFVAGTLVQMADGTIKKIEDVREGDLVLSRNPETRNPETGVMEAKPVVSRSVKAAPQVLTLTLTDPATHLTQTITCTPGHPFYVQGQGFVFAGDLGVGMSIVTRAGPCLSVTNIAYDPKYAGGVLVYNFTVEDDHTYFVGTVDGGTWVHNTSVSSEDDATPNRTEAFNQAKDFAGVPRSQQPVKQWQVGGDASRASNTNYKYSPRDSTAWGRYYEYNTPTGRRVIAEHLSDGQPHFHAGMQKDDTVFSGFKNERYLKVPGQPKHIYYGKN